MNEPRVRIRFDGAGRVYRPGDTLSGQYWLESIPAEDLRAVEISVLWYTEGKGDEDLAVHDFRRLSADESTTPLARSGHFNTVLPNSPLSYRGLIVKLHWCVRVRVFLPRGKEVVGEQGFRLGDVSAALATTT